jgi:hypothetical protein
VSERDSPLEPRDAALLRGLRELEPPSPEVQTRVRAKLAASVLATPIGAGGRGGAHGAAAGSAAGKVAIATVAFLVGGATGAALYAALRPPPPAQIILVPQPSVSPVPPALPSASTTTSEAPPSPPQGSAARSAASPPTPSSRKAQIAAERLLLDEARAALVQGDPVRALGRIELHRRTFANPILAEERDAMEVEALAKAGRTSEAKAKADAFRRRAPNSLFLPTVEAAVQSIP